MNIKVGQKLTRKMESDDHSWNKEYTVLKVTAKTLTVMDEKGRTETRKIMTTYSGNQYINVGYGGYIDLLN